MGRTIRKTIAVFMSIAVAVGTFSFSGFGGLIKANANSSDIDIYSRYATRLDAGDYDGYIRMNNSYFFMNDTDKSSEIINKSNMYDTYNLNADSKITCVDSNIKVSEAGASNIILKDGVISVNSDEGYSYVGFGKSNTGITMNKDSVMIFSKTTGEIQDIYNSNGETQIYDGIAQFSPYWIDRLTGPTYVVYCKYAAVIKDGKMGFIDINGKQIKLGKYEWYDNIISYDQGDDGIYYALYEKTSELGYDFFLIKEDGTELYSCEDVKEVNYIKGTGSVDYNCPGRYFSLEKLNGDNILIDYTGKIWYEGSAWDGIYQYGVGLEAVPLVLIQIDNYVIYINCKTGVSKKVTGKLGIKNKRYSSVSYCISVKSDNVLDIYDINMNMELTISGEYTDVSRLWDGYVLYSSDGKVKNVCDKNGNFIFPENQYDITISRSGYDVIAQDKTTLKEYYLDSSFQLISIDNADKIANDYINNTIGIKPVSIKKSYYDIGIMYNYYYDRIQGCILVTKGSGYTDVVEITDDGVCTVYGNSIHVTKPIKVIEEGGSQTKYRLSDIYIFNNGSVRLNKLDDNTNVYKSGKGIALYTDETKYYEVDADGNVIESPDWNVRKEETIVEQFGNSGAYYSYIQKTLKSYRVEYEYSDYKMFNKEGKELNVGIKELYNNDSISDIQLYSDMSDYGYLAFSYKLNGTDMLDIYNYMGKRLYQTKFENDNESNYKKEKKALFIDNKIIMLKNMFPQNIKELTAISSYYIDEGVNINMLKGISPNVNVKRIAEEFNYTDVKVVDKNNKQKDFSELLATGDNIILNNNDGVENMATIVIKGDTDGTGSIDVLDMEVIQKSILGIGDKLNGAYKEAALLTDGDDITVLDMEAIQKDILGIQKIN